MLNVVFCCKLQTKTYFSLVWLIENDCGHYYKLLYITFMNRIFVLFCLGLLHPLLADAQDAGELVIGYGSGDLEHSIGMGENNYPIYMKGAVQFPDSYMQRLKGNRITSVRVAMMAELTGQDNEVFIYRDLSSQPVYVQQVDSLVPGWNDIELDTPFEITGEELFVGFGCCSKGAVASFDGEYENDYGNWFAFSQIDVSEPDWYHERNFGCLNIEAVVEGSSLPVQDAAIEALYMSKCIPSQTEAPVDIVVRNMGADNIRSLEISCSAKGAKAWTAVVDGLDIGSNSRQLVTIDNMMFNEGISTMEFTIDRVNGGENTEADRKSYVTGNIICRSDYVNRNILLESFSTQECVVCPTAEKVIERNINKRSNVIRVVHHTGYLTDSFTIDDSEDYLFFFGDESPYSPAIMFDRTDMSQYGASGVSGPASDVDTKLFSSLLDNAGNVPAYVPVNIGCSYDGTSRTLKVKVSGRMPSGDAGKLQGDNICLSLFVTEDGIDGYQKDKDAGVIEHYVHDNVLRRVLTDTWGDKVSFSAAGEYESDEYELVVPTGWDDRNLNVIAFISNMDRAVPDNCVVYNCAVSKVADNVSLTQTEYRSGEADVRFGIVGGDMVIESNGSVEGGIYDAAGVLHKKIDGKTVNIDDLPSGLYILKLVTSDNYYKTLKFIK